MRTGRPVWLGLASRVCRLCVRLTPRRFRDRFGPESEDTFRHLVEDTLRSRGSGAAITTAAAACGDIARVGVAERASAWHGALLSGLTTDLSQASRVYWREPILAAAIALTLALVAGPTVAIFSVLYHIVLAPLPFPDADRLVVVTHQTPRGSTIFLRAFSVSDYRGVQAFSMVGGIFPVGSTVLTNGQPERVQSFRTTAGLLSGLGVPFAAGRDLQRGEPEAVVTRGFAQARFGSETAAIGQTMVVNRQSLTIVGVLGYPPPLPGQPRAELFIPHVSADRLVPLRQQGGQAIVVARLRIDSDLRVALEQAKAVAMGIRSQYGGQESTPELMPLRTVVGGGLRVPLLVLFGAVAVVFLIAVTSLASLVLARAAARASDVAVRTSLGASRWRLIRSWLLDGASLALPGIALGTWLGDLLLRYGRSSLPPGTLPLPEPGALAPMMVAALGLAGATAVLFAVAPVAAGLLRSPSVSLRDATRSVAGLRRGRSQSMLIVCQVAVSLVLVASAVWLSTSLWRLLSRPVGFDATNLVMVQTHSMQPRTVDQVRLVLDRFRQLDPGPGATAGSTPIERVAVTSSLPGVNASSYGPHRIRAGQPAFTEDDRPILARSAVSTGYFGLLEIPLLKGRYFTAEDDAVPERVIILSRSFAAKWFPEGAIGQVVTFVRDDRREVVGVVEDVHAGRLSQDSDPQFYVPMTEASLGVPANYLIRTSRPADAIRAEVSAVFREIDPSATVLVTSAENAMALPLTLQRAANTLTVGMALIALLLAVVNVYALSAFAVVQRTREIGIRIALGARSTDATRLVMRRGLGWVSVGLALGGAATMFLAAPLLRRQLFETRTDDPWLLSLAFLVVSGVAVAASWLPARRAALVDPAITLRAE